MAGRDQPEDGPNQEQGPGSGYTANPYDSPQTRAFGDAQDPTGQDPTAQIPHPTTQFQKPNDAFSAEQNAGWGNPPPQQPPQGPPYGGPPYGGPPPGGPPTSTPPYGMPLPPQQQPPGPPPQRGSILPWIIAAVVIFLLVVGAAVLFYVLSVDSESDASDRPTRSVAPSTATTTTEASPTTGTSFVPQFVAISGIVQSNDGSTLVITPDEGGEPVTVITDADTQVILGAGAGVEAFKAGDSVFVQGGEQEDGRVLARMIIGSLFGG